MSEASRQVARQIFSEAMAAATVEAAVSRLLSVRGRVLRAGDFSYDLGAFTNMQLVSIGKAGATLFDAVRRLLPGGMAVRSVVSAPVAPATLTGTDLYFAGGHPLPNAASVEAAKAALAMVREADAETLVLFLVSGGASAMFEEPVDPAISLADLIELNRQLVASGATIRQVNAVRKHLSAVKGGRLAAAAGTATKLTLLISDVPADALDALASGPTLPDSTTLEQMREIVEAFLPGLPASVRAALPRLKETPKAGDPAFENAGHVVLLDNAALLEAAKAAAERMGFAVEIDNGCDDWDYERAATYLLQRSTEFGRRCRRSCLLSGGEVTVRLPAVSGAGGRNQQLALFAAATLPAGTTLLSAGSDGIDGNSAAAGAVVDDTTYARARLQGLDPAAFLGSFDASALLAKVGDTIVTGVSGNNLRDIRILLTDADI
jgi:glycerate 2-kinase